jgi:hypothetical protein
MSSDDQAPDQESARPETEVDTKTTPKLTLGVWFRALWTLYIIVALGVGGIAETLSGHPNYFAGGTSLSILLIVYTGAAVAALIWSLAVRYRPTDPVRSHLTILTVTITTNVFLAISVWTIITQFIHPAASPHKIGLMVWWNLSDAIPLINVNSTLGWQQPLTGYSVQVGWLFLLQRIVLIVTLARVIQILFDRWVHYPRAETRKAATGSEHPEPPTDLKSWIYRTFH